MKVKKKQASGSAKPILFYGRWQEMLIYFLFWQELSRYQEYSYVASTTHNEKNQVMCS